MEHSFPGITLCSLITWHKCHPPRKTPVPVVTATLSLLLGTVVCCSFSWSAHLSVHLAVPSTAADSHRGSLTRWVLLPSCFTGEGTGAERGQETRPGEGVARSGMPGIGLRSTRNRSEEPPAPPGFGLSPGGAAPRRGLGVLPLASPDTRQERKWVGDTEGPAFPARGQQGSSTLQWWGRRGHCLEMTSGGAASPERSTWGLCRAARRGGTRNSVLTAPREESGGASARGM